MKSKSTAFLLGSLMVFLMALPAMANYPALNVYANPEFGSWAFAGPAPAPISITVVADDPAGIFFNWLGDASSYGGTIVGYRMGWDLIDPSNPMDPGWLHAEFGPWLETSPIVFSNGLHTFHLEVLDSNDAVSQATFLVDVQEDVGVEIMAWDKIRALFK